MPDLAAQPLVMTGTGLLSMEDGTLALELVLDGKLRVMVVIPKVGLSPLQECLFAMEELRDPNLAGMTAH